MVSIEALEFTYDGQRKFQFPDFSIDREPLLILGESGVGKTTLLHLIAGLLRPESGKVSIDGQEVSNLPLHKMDRFRGRHIGMVFQRPQFIRSLDLGENLRFIQYLSGKSPDNTRIKKVLDSLGLSDRINCASYMLSQGEQQRAAIAMALINHPTLILADEPTSSLDDRNCQNVIALLQQQAEVHQADLIIITHDLRLKEGFTQTLSL